MGIVRKLQNLWIGKFFPRIEVNHRYATMPYIPIAPSNVDTSLSDILLIETNKLYIFLTHYNLKGAAFIIHYFFKEGKIEKKKAVNFYDLRPFFS